MSDPWISDSLEDAIIDRKFFREISETGYERVVAKVDETGNIVYRKVDTDGYIIRGNSGNWP